MVIQIRHHSGALDPFCEYYRFSQNTSVYFQNILSSIFFALRMNNVDLTPDSVDVIVTAQYSDRRKCQHNRPPQYRQVQANHTQQQNSVSDKCAKKTTAETTTWNIRAGILVVVWNRISKHVNNNLNTDAKRDGFVSRFRYKTLECLPKYLGENIVFNSVCLWYG